MFELLRNMIIIALILIGVAVALWYLVGGIVVQ